MKTRAPRLRSTLLATALAVGTLAPLTASPALASHAKHGSIDGFVFGPDLVDGNVGMSNICVDAFSGDQVLRGSARTVATDGDEERGYYFIDELPAETYRLRVRDCGNQYATEDPFGFAGFDETFATVWAGEANSFAAAATVDIDGTEAASTGLFEGRRSTEDPLFGADEEMDVTIGALGGSVDGLVQNEADDTEIEGICVQLYGSTGNLVAETATLGGSTSAGTWAILNSLPGDDYRFQFRDDTAGCGSLTRPAGTAGALSSSNDGTATVGNSRAIAAGTQRFQGEYYNNVATLVAANAWKRTIPAGGGAPEDIDAKLTPISLNQGIQGTVKDDSGAAAGGVCVTAYSSLNSTGVTTTTNASGVYSLPLGLTSGTQGKYWVEIHERCVRGASDTYLNDDYVGEVHSNVHYSDDVAPAGNALVTLGSFVTPAESAKVTINQGSFLTLNPTIAKRGFIKGKVTDSAASPANLSGICVVAINGALAATDPPPFAVTGTGGTYTIPAVRPGTYQVHFLPVDPDSSDPTQHCDGATGQIDQPDYLPEYYQNSNSLAGATNVTVTNGQTRTNIDASLRETGTVYAISGRATHQGVAAPNDGAGGICVSALDLDGVLVSQASTATGPTPTDVGTYSIPNVPPGSYAVRFSRPSDCGGDVLAANSNDPRYIATEYHDNRSRVEDANPVVVSNANRTGINASVEAGGSISGNITYRGQTDGASLPSGTSPRDICVEAINGSQIVQRSTIVTSASPSYSFEGLKPGRFFVRFDDRDPNGTCGGAAFSSSTDVFQTEHYLDKKNFSTATPVDVAAFEAESQIDAAMNTFAPGPSQATALTGYVYTGTAPLNGIVVDLFRLDQDPGVDDPVFTTTTGSRTISRPTITCPPPSPAAFGQPNPDNPTTTDCETAPGTMPSTQDPIQGNADTTVQGYFRIDASNQSEPLTAGLYKVRFSDPRGQYATEWHFGRTTFASAVSVRLESGKVKEIGEQAFDADNYDCDRRKTQLTPQEQAQISPPSLNDNTDPDDRAAASRTFWTDFCGPAPTGVPVGNGSSELRTLLSAAGNVTGQVTRQDQGVAVKDVRVNLLDVETGEIVVSAFTKADGTYQMAGIKTGVYKAEFVPDDPTLSGEFYNDRETFNDADLVNVSSGTTTSNVSASLAGNTAPVAGDDFVQAEVNKTTVFGNLLGNDTDAEADALTITAVTQPDVHGTVVLNEDGTVSFTPAQDSQAETKFTYTIADESGLTSTATVTVTMVGEIFGSPPIAVDDEAATARDVSVVVNVLANDDDPDGDNAALRVVSTTTPFHGTATINDARTITYTPDPGFVGRDQFAYTILDAQGFSSSARVTIGVGTASINGVSRPVAAGETASTQGTTAERDNPIITSVTSPNAGTVTINETNGARTTSNGLTIIEPRVDITAPNASANNPLTITFRIDGSVLQGLQPQRAIRVLRNGAGLADCLGSSVASPDPCIAGHQRIADDVLLTIRTSAASTWTFGFLDEAVVDRAFAAGQGRVDTAVRVAREAFSPGEVDTVVIARSDNYPDALAGAPLAHQEGGPLLLTNSQALDAITRDEILRLRARNVIILGGTSAISTGVENTLRNLQGVESVQRISGKNRFETAKNVADQLLQYDSAYVVEGANADAGRGWPDAVSVASLAAFQGRPILLVTRDSVPAETRSALAGLASATIIGGTAAVSAAVQAEVDGIVGTVSRISGDSRYETSYQVALSARNAGMSVSSVWVATGLNFPDALAAGAAVAKEGGILLLVHGQDYSRSPRVGEFLRSFRNQVESVTIAGGPAAVASSVETRIRQDVVT